MLQNNKIHYIILHYNIPLSTPFKLYQKLFQELRSILGIHLHTLIKFITQKSKRTN